MTCNPIPRLLEKMTSSDQDFRFMATSDLINELERDSIKLDDDNERRVVSMVLNLLDDKNSGVQNLAVRCIGRLIIKVKESRARQIVDTLCTGMSGQNGHCRDVHSVCLRTVIGSLPDAGYPVSTSVCSRALPSLVNILRSDKSHFEIKMECLDMLNVLLTRFGMGLAQFHQLVQDSLLPLLCSERMAIRKRAVRGLSILVSQGGQAILDSVGTLLVDLLNQSTKSSTLCAYISCVGAVSVAAGGRFGPYLKEALPLIVHHCSTTEDDEVRESCLQAFESILSRCSFECTPYVNDILRLSMSYLCYDPNYSYGTVTDEGGTSSMDMDTLSSEEEEEDQEQFSDDDDLSWKVRRAAAKCVAAIINARRELLPEFYSTVAPLLIDRFKEREEIVKGEVFVAVSNLLKHTGLVAPYAPSVCEPSCNELLASVEALLPNLLGALSRQLRERSPKTKQNCFMVLSELLRTLPGALSRDFSLLVPGIIMALDGKQSSSELKMDVLFFLNDIITTHPISVLQPYVDALSQVLMRKADDSFYKVSAQSLVVLQSLMCALRPSLDQRFDWVAYSAPVTRLYEYVLAKLSSSDVDQEVKERAITCTGMLMANFGDLLMKDDVTCGLLILLNRMKNEVTRLTAVRAFVSIADSAIEVKMSSILMELVESLATFLRKSVRVLRLTTLRLLHLLVKRYGGEPLPTEELLAELPPLIDKTDLQLAESAVLLVTDVLKICPEAVLRLHARFLEPVLELLTIPLLYDISLATVYHFFFVFCRASSGYADFGFDQLKEALISLVVRSKTDLGQSKSLQQSCARCFGAVVVAEPIRAEQALQELCRNLEWIDSKNCSMQMFSILAISDIVRSLPDCLDRVDVEATFDAAFASDAEELKTVAAKAFGTMAVGNLAHFLPIILGRIQTQPRQQYLFLVSLLEVVSSARTDPRLIESLKPRMEEIWTVLTEQIDCAEEGVRSVVAECLGKLCITDPPIMLPRMAMLLGETKNPLGRATIAVAFKFAILDWPGQFDYVLQGSVKQFLATLTDSDLNVRRVALQALNSALHRKTVLMRDHVDEFVPAVYAETAVQEDLIREIEMGPFKQSVDDGLDLRSAAFSCMHTLLWKCFDRLNMPEFIKHVECGLRDHHDIQILTYIILIRLATMCPSDVMPRLELLLHPIKQVLIYKVKVNAVKQEYEKQEELKCYALRAFAVLKAMPDADRHAMVSDISTIIKNSGELSTLYQAIQRDPLVDIVEPEAEEPIDM